MSPALLFFGQAVEDIHDIRGPIHLSPGWEWVIWMLVALLIGGAIWWWLRRRPPVRVKLVHELALERLQKARGLMQPDQTRAFSIEVSEIVRSYIESRFQVLAARRTTEEFLYDLVASSEAKLTEHRPLLADFLRHCDLAKFAGWSLSLEEMETMIRSAEKFVQQTVEQPVTKNVKTGEKV
jgi:Domain of unknown function (DUF4381)